MSKNGENNFEPKIYFKKIPILPLDHRWHQLFPDNQKPARIKKLEKEVMSYVKREGGVKREMLELQRLKKNLMKEIVNNMQEADVSREKIRQKKLAASQKLIGDINDKITNLENEKYKLPYRLIEANKELLLASIEICYNQIHENERQIEALNEWIETTRVQLKKNVIVKQEKEEANHNIYSYMHDILGPEFMEQFDKGHGYTGDK